MSLVFIPAAFRPFADDVRSIELDGNTVRDLVDALEVRFPKLAGRLRDGDRLRSGIAVIVDSSVSVLGLRHPVTSGNEVHFVSAIGGG